MLQKGGAVPAFCCQIYHFSGVGLHIDERFTLFSKAVEAVFVLLAADHSSIRLQQDTVHWFALDHYIRDDDVRPVIAWDLIQGMGFDAYAGQSFRRIDPCKIAERRNQIYARLDQSIAGALWRSP